MKRNEVVKVIQDELENIHYGRLDTVYGFKRLSSDLLKKLEDLGMLPPERYRDHDWNEKGMTYSEWLQLPSKINEWESENENNS